jgi:glycosyltransferase involved in cell wall biosynthesis
MLCGKPIIASRVAGIESTIEDGKQGFLVLPGDKSELKARILQLVPDRNLRERMGSSGRERVRKYKASMVIPRYLEIVNQLLKQS